MILGRSKMAPCRRVRVLGVALLSVPALLIPGARGESAPPRLTLAKAIELALSDNYTLLAKQNELKSVRTGEITAGLSPNPQFGYTASNLSGRRGEFGRIDNDYTLQGTIETAGKREKRVGLAKGPADGVRILGTGDVTKKLIIKAHHFSKSADEKIKAKGGTTEVIPPPKKPIKNKMKPKKVKS